MQAGGPHAFPAARPEDTARARAAVLAMTQVPAAPADSQLTRPGARPPEAVRSSDPSGLIDATAVLERATFKVIASPTSGDFRLEVGLDGLMAGSVEAAVRVKGDRVAFKFGPPTRSRIPARCAQSSTRWKQAPISSASTTTPATSWDHTASGAGTSAPCLSRTGASSTCPAST